MFTAEVSIYVFYFKNKRNKQTKKKPMTTKQNYSKLTK